MSSELGLYRDLLGEIKTRVGEFGLFADAESGALRRGDAEKKRELIMDKNESGARRRGDAENQSSFSLRLGASAGNSAL